MSTTISAIPRSVLAEIYKLKRTAILWLALIGGTMVTALIFFVFLFEGAGIVESGMNPWDKYFNVSFSVVTSLALIPFVVLVTSSTMNYEHRSSSWKQLYTLPLSRGTFFFSKGITILGLLLVTYTVFFLSIIPSGYLLGKISPDYGFLEATPNIGALLNLLLHSFIAILGVTAFQYWLCYQWKNFLAPVGIGFLGFVIGPNILGKPKIAAFIPHSHPAGFASEAAIMGKDLEWLSNPEWYSLAFFVIFVSLGYIQETRRNVS